MTLFLSVFAVSCKTKSPTEEEAFPTSPKTSLSQLNKFDGIEIDVISLSKPVATTVEKRTDIKSGSTVIDCSTQHDSGVVGASSPLANA
ncbi:MAG: hypothetical protein AAGJ08_14840 [Cyanobacteria bacterium P01_H01_bin.35]